MSAQAAFFLGVLVGVAISVGVVCSFLVSFASVRAEDQDV